MKKHLPLFIVLLFSGILQFQLFSEQVLLTDDIYIAFGTKLELPFSEYLDYYFTNSRIGHHRPISVVLTIIHIYLIKYYGVNILFICYIYYIISLIFIYKVLYKITHRDIATLGVFIYSILPIGSFLSFSAIMMNSNLATIFYCISLLFIFKASDWRERDYI